MAPGGSNARLRLGGSWGRRLRPQQLLPEDLLEPSLEVRGRRCEEGLKIGCFPGGQLELPAGVEALFEQRLQARVLAGIQRLPEDLGGLLAIGVGLRRPHHE